MFATSSDNERSIGLGLICRSTLNNRPTQCGQPLSFSFVNTTPRCESRAELTALTDDFSTSRCGRPVSHEQNINTCLAGIQAQKAISFITNYAQHVE